jgi:hypothetical protein
MWVIGGVLVAQSVAIMTALGISLCYRQVASILTAHKFQPPETPKKGGESQHDFFQSVFLPSIAQELDRVFSTRRGDLHT